MSLENLLSRIGRRKTDINAVPIAGDVLPQTETIPQIKTGRGIVHRLSERRHASSEFRRARGELLTTKGTVRQQFLGQICDSDGRVPSQYYIGGLQLSGQLTRDENIKLAQHIHRELGTLPHVGDDRGAGVTPESLFFGGLVQNLALPIVPIPRVKYDRTGMSEEQVQDLVKLQEHVSRGGSVMLQIFVNSAEAGGGLVTSGIPEDLGGLGPDDNPDTKVQIAMNPGFKNQNQTARRVFETIRNAPIITARIAGLPHQSEAPQIPPPSK